MTARSEILTEAPPAESAERVAAERSLRERAAVYLELTKPRLSAMAVASAGAGYVLAGGGDPATMASLLAGAGCMAGASAVLNQVLERDLDLQMVRTRARPIPRGAIRPEEALTFGVLLGIAGSTLLAQAVHPASALVGLATLLGYVLFFFNVKGIT